MKTFVVKLSIGDITAQKEKFSIKDFFSKCVTFTEEIVNGKLDFLCSVFVEVLAKPPCEASHIGANIFWS